MVSRTLQSALRWDCVLVVMATTLVTLTLGVNVTLQAEKLVGDRPSVPRTQASNRRSVSFFAGDTLDYEFCLRAKTRVGVGDIRHSNDGASDLVDVFIDDDLVGSFMTSNHTDYGRNWNRFDSTGPLGDSLVLYPGKHLLQLRFLRTDVHGVEVDTVTLTLDDEDQHEELLTCRAYCQDDVTYPAPLRQDSLQSGLLRQSSVKTSCSQEQNVNLPLFHPTLRRFKVTAKPPRYRTLLNNNASDSSSCTSDLDSLFWEFANFSTAGSSVLIHSNATLSVSSDAVTKVTTLAVTFNSSVSPKPGQDIRALLSLRLTEHVESLGGFRVHIGYPTLKGWVSGVGPSATSGYGMTWDLRDLLVSGEDTRVELSVLVNPLATPEVEDLRLEWISKPERATELFQDSQLRIEGARLDRWWLGEGAMTVVRNDSAKVWSGLQVLKVFRASAWSEDYSEVLRLYQDGSLYLNTMRPLGSSYIPFGSFLLLGQTNVTDTQPRNPVSKIDLDPYDPVLTVFFQDGSVFRLRMRTVGFDTEVTVEILNLSRDQASYPVATLRSTWVADGNADVDHVSADGAEARGVLGPWQTLYGTSFAFFRRCVSFHNSQSPDLLLELLGETVSKA